MLKIACIATFVLLSASIQSQAQIKVETELFLGPAFTSIDGAVRVGLGVGGGCALQLASFAGGSILARGSIMPVFAIDSVDGLIIEHLHIPLTVALSFQEPRQDGHPYGLGGSIGLGMLAVPSRITLPRVSLQPCATFDLTFGVFDRGALTFRYIAGLGAYLLPDGRSVGFQSFTFIGSTNW